MTDQPTNPTDRPELRPAAPERASVNGHRPTDTDTDRHPGRVARLFAALTRRADRSKATDVDRPTMPAPTVTVEPTGSGRPWRSTTPTVGRPVRSTDPTVVAAAAAANRRPTAPTPTTRPRTEAEIAPVPHKLKWLGVWLDRTFGAMPLLAPLLVSGYYTMQVFTGEPINAHPLVAVLAACALEGGVWKLSRLYEKTLVAGDSTMALRAGIGGYLALISGLIYWHADHAAQLKGQAELGADALPAVGVAIMSALGVFIWSRTARWTRRRELHAQGRVDTQAPKFAALAWILCPIETPKALRHAVKYRIPGPVEAVADLRLYKAAGKPAVWPPLVDVDPTDRPTGEVQQPTGRTSTVEPTRPEQIVPVADRPATPPTAASRPTAAAPRPQPTATRSTTVTPTAPAGKPTDQADFTAAAIRNAGIIRDTYGTKTDLRLGTVRSDLGWSFDRANPALQAYLAGADRPDQPEEPATDAPALAHTR